MAAILTLSKWGNSSGIRIPETALDTLEMQDGDQFTYEVSHDVIILRPVRRRKTTKELFEQFYHKPFSEIDESDLGNDEEMDWGDDAGAEVLE